MYDLRFIWKMMFTLLCALVMAMPIVAPAVAEASTYDDVQKKLEGRTKEDIFAHWLKYKQLSMKDYHVPISEMFEEPQIPNIPTASAKSNRTI